MGKELFVPAMTERILEDMNEGERAVCEALLKDPSCKKWTLFHSFKLSEHIKKVAGEIDIIAAIPEQGILCIEVKGYHDAVDAAEVNRNLKQAWDNQTSLIEFLKARKGFLSEIPISHVVIYPFLECSHNSKLHDGKAWEILDKSSMECIRKSLQDSMAKSRELLYQKNKLPNFKPGNYRPNETDISLLAMNLRPQIIQSAPVLTPPAAVEEEKQEGKDYRSLFYDAHQVEALHYMQSNSRILFYGMAGTGKTLLAIESVRKYTASGKKTLFLCFNRILGQWLKSQMAGVENLTVSTLHQHMSSLCEIEETGDLKQFYECILPATAQDNIVEKYDALVLDEAQDILALKLNRDFLDASLHGGLEGGEWRFFGDIEHQGIHQGGRKLLEPKTLADEYHCALHTLDVNYRNPKSIAQLGERVADINPGYRDIYRKDEKAGPFIQYYSQSDDEVNKLAETINYLVRKQNLKLEKITVLSFKKPDHCASRKMIEQGQAPFEMEVCCDQNLNQLKGKIGYTSIHAFKGMESPVIIITDVCDISRTTFNARDLLYVGVTRALSQLIILAHEKDRELLEDWKEGVIHTV